MSFNIRRFLKTALTLCAIATLSLVMMGVKANAAEQVIYADGIQNGWQSWSWAKANLDNKKPVHSGSKSVSVLVKDPFGAAYFHHNTINTKGYKTIDAWIFNGASKPITVAVAALANGKSIKSMMVNPVPPKKWFHIVAPLQALGASNKNIDGVWFQDETGQKGHTFYLDDIKLK